MSDFQLPLASMTQVSKYGAWMFHNAQSTWFVLEKIQPVTPTWTILCPHQAQNVGTLLRQLLKPSRTATSFLVTVPTPITHDLKPDLSYVEAAGRAVFESVKKGSNTIVVLESTVYPGVTAQTWLPIVEELGLVIGEDLEIAYCPERFNPGDAAHGVRPSLASSAVQTQKLASRSFNCIQS